MTDSSHNNRNAVLYGQFVDNILFWEQELDSATTQLCYKSMDSASGDMHVALSLPGIKLTNPKILDLSQGYSLTEVKVFYETNQGNDIDLNYFTYKADGTIIGPIVLASLPGDDVNLTTGNSGTAAWENGGKIWVSQYLYESNSFSEPFVIDSAGAYSPVSSNNLNYLKPVGDSTTIFSEDVFYYQGNWLVNAKISKSFIGKGVSLSTDGGGPLYGGSAAIQNKIGNNPSGLILFPFGLSDIEYRNSPTYSLSQPTIADYQIRVKSIGYDFLAYVSDSLAQNEIFVETPFSYYSGPQNISQWPGDDRNPQFFETWIAFDQIRLFLFWESERQGYSTIFYSYFDYTVYGGIDEYPKAEAIIATPCPFDCQTTIMFKSSDNTIVRIFNLQGQKVKTLLSEKDSEGWNFAVWDGTDNYGNSVPLGGYVIVAGSGSATQSRIIIKK